jgi:hypothetical protein
MSLRKVLSAVCLVVTLCVAGLGATINVAATGSDTIGDGSAGNPFATIQKGIDTASAGDIVLVAEGTYAENVDFKGKNVSLLGSDQGDGAVIAATVIDGGQNGPCITLGHGERAVLVSGFTITNGKADQGGGVYCKDSSAMIANCVITGNAATLGGWYQGGGGILCNGYASVRVTSCTITNNTAFMGAGVYCSYGAHGTVTGCDIHDNTAQSGGGGIGFYNAFGAVENCKIDDNTTTGWDGGGILVQQDAAAIIWSCTIWNNTAIGGGGISFIEAGYTGAPGGVVAYCDIEGNKCGPYGGGGGIHCQETSLVAIANNLICGNATSEDGGGVLCEWSGQATLVNDTIAGNESKSGISGLAVTGNAKARMENCIVTDNTSQGAWQVGVWIGGGPGTVSLDLRYSCIQGGKASVFNADNRLKWGAGNIDADPLFVAAGSLDNNGTPTNVLDDTWTPGDYHLRSAAGRFDPSADGGRGGVVFDLVTSPCIDAGNPSDPFGLEPAPNGNRVDMGAYGNMSKASFSPHAVRAKRSPSGFPSFCTTMTNAVSRRIIHMEQLTPKGWVAYWHKLLADE